MATRDLTSARLRERLHYDPDNGLFTWIPGSSKFSRFDGRTAGNICPKGYVKIAIDGRIYAAHRLAFLYMLGRWPEDQVDHINGVRNDNRWANIREVDRQTNAQNVRKAPVTNASSGLLGATFDALSGLWRSQIMHNGRTHYIGLFSTPVDAHNAYVGVKRIIHAAGNTL